MLCFKSLNGLGPAYIKNLLTPYQPKRKLRSCSLNNLCTPKTRLKTYEDRDFTSSGPSTWNSLPVYIKQITETGPKQFRDLEFLLLLDLCM